jgi:hypothetical protein
LNTTLNRWRRCNWQWRKADGHGAGAVARGIAASRSGFGRSNGVRQNCRRFIRAKFYAKIHAVELAKQNRHHHSQTLANGGDRK